MKLIICSDIHGDFKGASYAVSALEKYNAERLVILGDLLYHGPRNDLPEAYNPKEVIRLLNENKDRIIAVRGNCDAEVDGMVLEFPIMSEFRTINDGDRRLILNHGHHIDLSNPPKMNQGDILLCGHTHIPQMTRFGKDNLYVNPGSISIPKSNFPRTFLIYDNGDFSFKSVDGYDIIPTN